MNTEEILSAGIDIGTSTTQLVFSRLVLQNIGGFGKIPQIKVISKEVIYKSDVYFTPLSSQEEINGKEVKDIIKKEYKKAGIQPEELATGAVIITGESSKKKNAKEIVEAISEVAGDFVVATAGADLESILAGKGAGAAWISQKKEKIVANLDIGGGTTNICVFENGEIIDTACLDIGGRLVKLLDGKIKYIAPKIKTLLKMYHIPLKEGDDANEFILRQLTDIMASLLAQSVNLLPKTEALNFIATNHLLTTKKEIEVLTFSGGVATCFSQEKDIFKYGDIGILLAQSIKKMTAFQKIEIDKAFETMHATVIGAGNYSMNISGSTIEYTEDTFPIKNIPVVKIPLAVEEDISNLAENIHKAVKLYQEKGDRTIQVALAMNGLKCPTFAQIQQIAKSISEQFSLEFEKGNKLIVIFEQDIGKAVGQALHRFDKDKRVIVCIDGINCDSGDYIDLGEPVASGNVIPVVVKTLIFNR